MAGDGNLPGGNGADGQYQTFQGGGFGTLIIHGPNGGARGEAPSVASRRAYLRRGLPALYQEGDFGMRFIGALESVLDPVLAILDALPAYFDPDLAPRDTLGLMSAWLGIELDESHTTDERRELVRRAAELSRRRGTVAGLRLALRLNFPGLPLRVEDQGGVVWARDGQVPNASATPTSFVVYCDEPIPEQRQAAVARCIEHVKPVHTTYRLRVKAPKKPAPPS